MKKLLIPILSVALSLAAVSLVSAQGPDENGPRPHHHGQPNLTEMLNHTLQLTNAQKTQVQPLVDTAQQKLKAIHEQARAQADVVLKQLDSQIRPFLDPRSRRNSTRSRRCAIPGKVRRNSFSVWSAEQGAVEKSTALFAFRRFSGRCIDSRFDSSRFRA